MIKKTGQNAVNAGNNWLQLYHDALLETDDAVLPERLKVAKDAIRSRTRQLGERERTLERKAMGYALNNIAEIQKHK